MTKLILFDMDGTLSDDRQRHHLYLNGEFEEYFSYQAQIADPPYEAAVALYDEMVNRKGWVPGYLSARLERNRPASVDWLTINGFANADSIFLRPEELSHMRPPRFKSLKVGELIDTGRYDSIVVVDNDPLVIERITEDHGAGYAFFADWDMNPKMASIQNVAVEPI